MRPMQLYFLSLALLTMAMVPAMGQAQSRQKAIEDIVQDIAQPLKPVEGSIAAIKGRDIYVDLGRLDGIQKGNMLKIVRLGEDIEINNKVIGKIRTEIGEIKIVQVVNDKLSIGTLVSSMEEPKKYDRVFSHGKETTSIGIMADAGALPETEGITRDIQNALSQYSWIEVVDRSASGMKISQTELGMMQKHAGIIDPSTAKIFGKRIGADGFLLVNVIKRESDTYQISAKLQQTETGVLLAHASATFTEVRICCCEKIIQENELYARRQERWQVSSKNYKWIAAQQCNREILVDDGQSKVTYLCASDSLCGK